jgi:hypothetical protein
VSGETIRRDEAGKIGIGASIKNDEQSLNAFLNFLELLHILGYESFILLIDEFEYLFSRGGQQGAQFLNTFRFLYDRALERLSGGENLANPIFVPACSIFTWNEKIKKASEEALGTQPFKDRAQEPIVLPPFNHTETRLLIRDRLDKWRIDTSDKKRIGVFPFVDEKGDDYPFDFITKISNNGLPRHILRRTATILELAYERNYASIGLKEVELLARDLGFEPTKK